MDKKVIYSLKDAAICLAECADRILRGSPDQSNVEIDIAPIFVFMLFQSLEVSLKYFGIESDLITERESRDKELTKNGHGVKEIAKLINAKLSAQGNYIFYANMPILSAREDFLVVGKLTAGLVKTDDTSSCRDVVYKMLFGKSLKEREKYIDQEIFCICN